MFGVGLELPHNLPKCHHMQNCAVLLHMLFALPSPEWISPRQITGVVDGAKQGNVVTKNNDHTSFSPVLIGMPAGDGPLFLLWLWCEVSAAGLEAEAPERTRVVIEPGLL